MFSNYRSHIWLELSGMLGSQRERWMRSAHRSLGSLGNRAHRSNKEIKATMSRVISRISLGFVWAPCAVGRRRGAEQGHLPGCPGASHSLPGAGWHCLLWDWCVCEITLHPFHAVAAGAGVPGKVHKDFSIALGFVVLLFLVFWVFFFHFVLLFKNKQMPCAWRRG